MSAPAIVRYRVFQIGDALLALNCLVPATSYVFAPELAVESMDQVNRLLGGGAWPSPEQTKPWHMLAFGNVATLGLMCLLFLLANVRRLFSVLIALAFLKGFSAVFSLAKGLDGRAVGFFAIFALDKNHHSRARRPRAHGAPRPAGEAARPPPVALSLPLARIQRRTPCQTVSRASGPPSASRGGTSTSSRACRRSSAKASA